MFSTVFMLALFQWCFQKILQQATRKTYNFVPIISGNHPIIPEYSPILSTTYYSRNYAGIIDACLVSYTKVSIFVHVGFNITMLKVSKFAPQIAHLFDAHFGSCQGAVYIKRKNNHISSYKSTAQLLALHAHCIFEWR